MGYRFPLVKNLPNMNEWVCEQPVPWSTSHKYEKRNKRYKSCVYGVTPKMSGDWVTGGKESTATTTFMG